MAQKAVSTSYNRYPEIFSSAKFLIEQTGERAKNQLKLLSFGCSHGHEMASLSQYFPHAQIFGCDVNVDALASAQKLKVGTVFQSTPENIKLNGPFDAVFALSVLCLTKADDLARQFPFSEFEGLVKGIDAGLRPGGVFCVFNANYRFADLELSHQYRPVTSDLVVETGYADDKVPLLTASGEKLNRFAEPPVCIYQKRQGEPVHISPMLFPIPLLNLPMIGGSAESKRAAAEEAARHFLTAKIKLAASDMKRLVVRMVRGSSVAKMKP